MEDICEFIVNEILEDLTDRAGLSDEWNNFDDYKKQKIATAWSGIVRRELRTAELLP